MRKTSRRNATMRCQGVIKRNTSPLLQEAYGNVWV